MVTKIIRVIKNIFHYVEALFAVALYGYPARNLTVIGVTGTDGKTTTASLIHHILQNANQKAGLISTVGAKINDKDFSIGLHTTTPSSFKIQKLLKKMVNNECKYAIIEVTSHSIDQNRIIGCNFIIGVLTNITKEHLDYHNSFTSYQNTKIKFLKKCPIIIINKDDQSFNTINDNINDKKIFSYGIINKGDLFAANIETKKYLQSFDVGGKINNQDFNKRIETKLIGKFNIENILASIGSAIILKIPQEKIISGIKTFSSVKGRMEMIIDNPYKIIIDFAHTPNAFDKILTTVRLYTKGKIIHVFGATGNRDKTKRPEMGKISGMLADISIITSEDTYGEDPKNIIIDIEKGIKKTNKKENISYWKIVEREDAIKKAVSLAKKDDLILLTGVGHQTSLNLGKYELPWSDKQTVLKILKINA